MQALTTALALLVAAQASPRESLERCGVPPSTDVNALVLDRQLDVLSCFLQERGVSPAGSAAYVAGVRSEQRQIAQTEQALSETLNDIRHAAEAKPFNADAFEAALRQYRQMQSARFLAATDAEIRIFDALPPADRPIIAGLMTGANGASFRLGVPGKLIKGAK